MVFSFAIARVPAYTAILLHLVRLSGILCVCQALCYCILCVCQDVFLKAY